MKPLEGSWESLTTWLWSNHTTGLHGQRPDPNVSRLKVAAVRGGAAKSTRAVEFCVSGWSAACDRFGSSACLG